MKSIVILYATREGHTKKIAEHLAASFCQLGFDAPVKRIDGTAAIDLSSYDGAILAASVHIGKHEREMVRFVKQHLAALSSLPTAFLSVTLSEAGVERAGQSQEVRARCEAGVGQVIDRFLEETNWRPTHVKPIAGALLYSKYNPLVRFVMKQIAKSEGGDTDTSRDYEYTDWVALDHFAGEFFQEMLSSTPGPTVREDIPTCS